MRARAVSAPGDQRQNVGGHLPQLALDRILAAGFTVLQTSMSDT
jgi:hypothetical protein